MHLRRLSMCPSIVYTEWGILFFYKTYKATPKYAGRIHVKTRMYYELIHNHVQSRCVCVAFQRHLIASKKHDEGFTVWHTG